MQTDLEYEEDSFYQDSGGDTSLSGNDDNGLALSFTDGSLVDVFLNGILLDPNTDYNTSTTNTIGSIVFTSEQ